MSDDPVDNPRAELALVERELAEASKEVEELRRELGDRSDGAGDAVDTSNLIEQVNATESLLRDLEGRREDLRTRIEASPTE